MVLRYLFLLLALAAQTIQAEDRPRLRPLTKPSENAKTGPAVGSLIPSFEAMDQNGAAQTFEKLRGTKGLMLAFSRSADWCPYCKAQLSDINRQLDRLKKRGINVASVTYDSPEILKAFAARKDIRYPMLSDPDSKIIRAFGILNGNIEPGTRGYGIPFPGIYVVDAKGIVKSKYFEDDYRERHTAGSIITHEFGQDGSDSAGLDQTKIETPQLTLSNWAADKALAPGAHTTLVVELALKPQMHAYAPGVKSDYIPVDWIMNDAKTSLALPAKYPAAKDQYFSAMKETVPVYTKQIRIERDLVIGQQAEIADSLSPDKTLTVEGVFKYQACDEKKCFPPRDIPLKWTFQMNAPDTDRVPEAIRKEK